MNMLYPRITADFYLSSSASFLKIAALRCIRLRFALRFVLLERAFLARILLVFFELEAIFYSPDEIFFKCPLILKN